MKINSSKKTFFITLGFILSCCFPLSSFATDKAKGELIAQQIEKANKEFIGSKSELEMVVKINGSEVRREMERLSMEVAGDGVRSLFIFHKPNDIRGTKLLTWSHLDRSDDQWLYLKSIKRVKRISSSSKTSSFMGSEFTYEDLGGQEKEKYTTRWLRDDSLDGEKVWVLEQTPKQASGYSKIISYVSQSKKSALKNDYYDRGGHLFKQALFKKLTLYKVAGKSMYRTQKIVMDNMRDHRQSVLIWKKRALGIQNSSNLFQSQRLGR